MTVFFFLLNYPFHNMFWRTREKYFYSTLCLCFILTRQNLLKVIIINDALSFNQSVAFQHQPESPPKSIIPGHDVWNDFLGSPKSTIIQSGKCECFLNYIDCLDFIECMSSQDDQKRLVREGIMIRRIIKANTTTFSGQPVDEYFLDNETISFSLQAVSIAVWRKWLSKQDLPVGMVSRTVSVAN
jgi:hypothetical protein